MDLQINPIKPLIFWLICTAQALSYGKRCSQKNSSIQVPNCHSLSNRDLKLFHTRGLFSTNKKPHCVQKVGPARRLYGRVSSPVNMNANSVKGLSGRNRPLQVTAESPDRPTRHWTSRLRRARPPSTGLRERANYHTATREIAILITVIWAFLAAVSAITNPEGFDFFSKVLLVPPSSKWAKGKMESILPWKLFTTQQDQLFGWIDLKILISKNEDISHLVNDRRFYKNLQGSKLGITGHEPNCIQNFVSKFIQPFCNSRLDPVDLAGSDQVHVLFSSGLTPLLPSHSTAPLPDFHHKFGKDLTVFTSKIIACNYCDFTANNFSDVQLHFASSHNTHPINPGMGGKSCNLSTSLNNLHTHIRYDHTISTWEARHASTHRGWKPFVCLTCDGKTNYRSHLKKPLRAQTKVKPHQCEGCGHKTGSKSDSKIQGGTNHNIFFNGPLLHHAIVLAHPLPSIFLSFRANVLSDQLPEQGHTQKTPRPPGRGSQATVLLFMPFTVS